MWVLQTCYIQKGLNVLYLNQHLSQIQFIPYPMLLWLHEKHFIDSEEER